MYFTNENLLRGCLQEAQRASVSLSQAIVAIATCATPQSAEEAKILWLLRTNVRAIKNIDQLLAAIPLTGHED